jgi:hypothetical protein
MPTEKMPDGPFQSDRIKNPGNSRERRGILTERLRRLISAQQEK